MVAYDKRFSCLWLDFGGSRCLSELWRGLVRLAFSVDDLGDALRLFEDLGPHPLAAVKESTFHGCAVVQCFLHLAYERLGGGVLDPAWILFGRACVPQSLLERCELFPQIA